MNPLNYISDEEFLPFLQSLGVESDRKSFEWMFNDPELSGVLQWLYNSLDHSNALSAREKYRNLCRCSQGAEHIMGTVRGPWLRRPGREEDNLNKKSPQTQGGNVPMGTAGGRPVTSATLDGPGTRRCISLLAGMGVTPQATYLSTLLVGTTMNRSNNQKRLNINYKNLRKSNVKSIMTKKAAERMRLLKDSGLLDEYIAQSNGTGSDVKLFGLIKNVQAVINRNARRLTWKRFNRPGNAETNKAEDDVIIVEDTEIIDLDPEEPVETSDSNDYDHKEPRTSKRRHSDDAGNDSISKKRCLPNTSCNKEDYDQFSHLGVNIISSDSNKSLTEEQSKLLKRELEKKLCEYVEDEKNTLAPVFEHSPKVRQGVALDCYDEFTYAWLKETVSNITGIWEGCDLKVVLAAAMKSPMGTVEIPAAEGTVDELKAHLDRMNKRWFNMSQWAVVGHRYRNTDGGKVVEIDLGVPSSDLESLARRNYRLCYKLGVIRINMAPHTSVVV